jgi:hypothetical protein
MDDRLAQDLVALWQSELTAMAADRELREGWAAMVALWAGSANAALQTMPRPPHDTAFGSARPVEPAGPAPVAAASQPGLAEIEQLTRRIAELEQRLGEFLRDRPGDPAGP